MPFFDRVKEIYETEKEKQGVHRIEGYVCKYILGVT